MVLLPPGQIRMRDEGTRLEWEVEVRAFALSSVPVTRADYTSLDPRSTRSSSPDLPMVEVSWLDAVDFCNRLSEVAGLRACYTIGHDPDGQDTTCDWRADGFRLPSEAEWEYACRASNSDVRYGDLAEIAWFRGNAEDRLHPVGQRKPNAWGLYDMIGNAWEWCWDLFDPEIYGAYRVFRGGGWMDKHWACRASCRRKSHPALRIDDLGFRLARSLRPPSVDPV
ncbi:MAG: formylglycine-generating enzyme family protein [Myxococcales bacterium FL481]|nr:MAG: formylglycine-generating enzyme family protein [Myxococcales bacterium FL481]